MVDRLRGRSSVRTAVVWDVLREALAETPLDVLDVGGGTGGFAVPMAALGHTVTVVDSSPDALAALERRAAEAGVPVRALQGDATGLLDVVEADSVDVVLCHGVLEYVDDPREAVQGLRTVLRPGGTASVLAANRHAAVLSRAVAGHLGEARHAFDDPDGRWSEADPVPRRFTLDELAGLLTGAGLEIHAVHGIRVFSDLVPSGVADGEPGALEELLALESAVAEHPVFQAIAGQLHMLAVRR